MKILGGRQWRGLKSAVFAHLSPRLGHIYIENFSARDILLVPLSSFIWSTVFISCCVLWQILYVYFYVSEINFSNVW